MLSNARSSGRFASRFSVITLALLTFLAVFAVSGNLWGQTTVGTGSIVGTVTDQSGAVVSGAKVGIANQATGQTIDVTTNSAGAYNSGALSPGTYKVQISSKGF